MPKGSGKITKVSADYSKGLPRAHCGICRHYDAQDHTCSIVAGKIDPAMWCRYFRGKAGS